MFNFLLIFGLLGALSASGALVIEAAQAAVKTVGGPAAGGGWNLWSDGELGQPVRVGRGSVQIIARVWGSPAGGVWPEMALVVDGDRFQTVSVTSTNHADYPFNVPLSAGVHEIAVAYLNDAVIGNEDRNLYVERLTIVAPAGAAEPVRADSRELAEQADQRERTLVAETAAAIARHRQSDAVLRLVGADGQPLRGASLTVTQTAHEFLFGCNIYKFDECRTPAENAAYKQRFAALFNYATVGFYWRWYEPQRGQPHYAYTDKVVAWCAAHGIRMKGHPLLWGNEAGVPPWAHGQPAPEIQRQRVEQIMQRYRDRFFAWEVVNEPAHERAIKIDEPYRWARAANANACLIVNDYHIFADGCPQFFQLLTTATQTGVPFDGIGIQAHEPRPMRFPLDRVQRTLDHYATLGKELHITEFTPTSGGDQITGSHRHGPWDEAAQADYAEKFYRVCFAHPAVRAITWWDLSDQGSWLNGGGLVHADMSPKPAYDALRRLIHDEWHTQRTGTTDADGQFHFRGFRGTYRLVVNGTEQQFQLPRNPAQPITLTVR